jgi:hypothetical protein
MTGRNRCHTQPAAPSIEILRPETFHPRIIEGPKSVSNPGIGRGVGVRNGPFFYFFA